MTEPNKGIARFKGFIAAQPGYSVINLIGGELHYEPVMGWLPSLVEGEGEHLTVEHPLPIIHTGRLPRSPYVVRYPDGHYHNFGARTNIQLESEADVLMLLRYALVRLMVE